MLVKDFNWLDWLGSACSRIIFLTSPMRSQRIWPKEKTLQMRYRLKCSMESHHSLWSVVIQDEHSNWTISESFLIIQNWKLTAAGIRARVSRGRRLDGGENTDGNSPMQPRQLQINEQSDGNSNDNRSRSADGGGGGSRGSRSGWDRITSRYYLAKSIHYLFHILTM